MSGVKRRKNQFREALDAKREALTRAANQPKPEPAWIRRSSWVGSVPFARTSSALLSRSCWRLGRAHIAA
jgi:hypothetical protein